MENRFIFKIKELKGEKFITPKNKELAKLEWNTLSTAKTYFNKLDYSEIQYSLFAIDNYKNTKSLIRSSKVNESFKNYVNQDLLKSVRFMGKNYKVGDIIENNMLHPFVKYAAVDYRYTQSVSKDQRRYELKFKSDIELDNIFTSYDHELKWNQGDLNYNKKFKLLNITDDGITVALNRLSGGSCKVYGRPEFGTTDIYKTQVVRKIYKKENKILFI